MLQKCKLLLLILATLLIISCTAKEVTPQFTENVNGFISDKFSDKKVQFRVDLPLNNVDETHCYEEFLKTHTSYKLDLSGGDYYCKLFQVSSFIQNEKIISTLNCICYYK